MGHERKRTEAQLEYPTAGRIYASGIEMVIDDQSVGELFNKDNQHILTNSVECL